MKKDSFNTEETEAILNSLDGMHRAEMPAFFFTRLQARLDQQAEQGSGFWKLVTKPAVSLVTLSLLLLINIAAINGYLKTQQHSNTSQVNTGIEGFAQEYSLDQTAIYNEKTEGHELLQQK